MAATRNPIPRKTAPTADVAEFAILPMTAATTQATKSPSMLTNPFFCVFLSMFLVDPMTDIDFY
jgi:hypothetical protein